MPDADSQPRSTAWQNAVTVLQEATPPWIPDGAHAMTITIEYPPGDPGTLHTGMRDRHSAMCSRAKCSSSWRASRRE